MTTAPVGSLAGESACPTWNRRFRLFVLILVSAPGLFAQAPVISSVVNYARGDTRLSPGSIAQISGTNLEHAACGAVTIGGRKALCRGLLSGDDAYWVHFDIALPTDLPAGPATLVVTNAAGSSTPFPIDIGDYAPALIYPYFSRTPAPPPLAIFNPYVPCAIQETAAPGEILTAYATGLGAVDGAGNTILRPSIKVGEATAELLESVLPGGQGEIYRLTFRVPPGDGLQSVVVTIGAQDSPPRLLPVGNVAVNRLSLGLYQAAAESIVEPSICAYLPHGLSGAVVKVKDSAGVERVASYAEGTRYVVPAGTANGLATVSITSDFGQVFTGYLDIRSVAPASDLISPFVSGYAVRVRNGIVTAEPAKTTLEGSVSGYDIDMGPDTDQVYLILLSSGLRNSKSPDNVRVLIGDHVAPVEYIGPQGQIAGLDQMNIRLPRSLAGRGRLVLQYTVNGIPDNIFYTDNFIYVRLR